jgi:hypothetical protein
VLDRGKGESRPEHRGSTVTKTHAIAIGEAVQERMEAMMSLSQEDAEALRTAKNLLEHPSLAAKITSIVGTPMAKGFDLLPVKWSEVVNSATRIALEQALNVALLTVDDTGERTSSNTIHKLAVAAVGAAGGLFGLPALAVELPVSTTVILRSIADIARSEGEPLHSSEAKLACLEVPQAILRYGRASRKRCPRRRGTLDSRASPGRALPQSSGS